MVSREPETDNQPPPSPISSCSPAIGTRLLRTQNPETFSIFAVICEEAWYDSVSMLGESADYDSDFDDDDEDDDPDNDFASVSGGKSNALTRLIFLLQRCSVQNSDTDPISVNFQILSRMSSSLAAAARTRRPARTRRAWRTPCSGSGASPTRRRARETRRRRPMMMARVLLLMSA